MHHRFDSFTSASAWTGIVRFVKRFSKVHGAFQTSYDARQRTVRSPVTSYDLNFKLKSSGARLMCANADRAPSGHRTLPGRCHFTLSDPTKRRTGAVEFVPKLYRVPYDVLINDQKLYDSFCRRI